MGYKFARIHWRGRHSYPQGPLLPERSQSWFASFTLPTRWFQTSFSTHSDDHRPLTEAKVLKAGNSTKGEKEHDGLEAMVVGRRKFWLEILRNCKRSLWTSQLIPDGSHWGLGGRVEAATLSHEQGTRHVPSRASSCLPPRPARPAHSVSDNLIYSLTSEMTPPYIFLLLHLKNGLLWFRFFFFFASFCKSLQVCMANSCLWEPDVTVLLEVSHRGFWEPWGSGLIWPIFPFLALSLYTHPIGLPPPIVQTPT